MSVAAPAGRGWVETVAIVLLLVGGFLGGVGWLAGVVLLWLSDRWSTGDKLIGTFVLPGGLAFAPFLFIFVAVGGSGRPVYEVVLVAMAFAACIVAPITTAARLARTSR